MGTRIWVGFATALDAREVIGRYIDPLAVESFALDGELDEDEAARGALERNFGAAYVSPGSYEVYDVAELDGGVLTVRSYLSHAPFDVDLPGLEASDERASATAVFFVAQPEQPMQRTDGTVTITDVVDVRFEWEAAAT